MEIVNEKWWIEIEWVIHLYMKTSLSGELEQPLAAGGCRRKIEEKWKLKGFFEWVTSPKTRNDPFI